MSDKTKKAIRERMAQTGETYSTARMHVLGTQRHDGGSGSGVSRMRQLVEGIILAAGGSDRAGRPDDDALASNLRALDDDDLRKVEVLFYAGREQGVDVLELAADLGRDLPRAAAEHLVEKSPVFVEYVRLGLRSAEIQGVDLDAAWPSPPLSPGRWFIVRGFRATHERLPNEPAVVVTGAIVNDGIELRLNGALLGMLTGTDGGRDRHGPWIAVEVGEARLDTGLPVNVKYSVDGYERAVAGVEIDIVVDSVDDAPAIVSVWFDLDGRWCGGGLPDRKLRPEDLAAFLA